MGLDRLEAWEEGGPGDHLIVTGDFGHPWDYSADECAKIAWLESRPYTVLFVDGNHERYDHWSGRRVEPWCGGAIQRLSPHSPIRRLMRSEVYEIDGVRIFTLGGAASIDRASRIPFATWWPQEIPTERNFDEARANLSARDWEVDYVVTRTCPRSILASTLFPATPTPGLEDEALTAFLDEVDRKLDFKRWCYGHFHRDRDVDARHTTLFERIVPLGAGIAGSVSTVPKKTETQKRWGPRARPSIVAAP